MISAVSVPDPEKEGSIDLKYTKKLQPRLVQLFQGVNGDLKELKSTSTTLINRLNTQDKLITQLTSKLNELSNKYGIK